MILIEIPSYKCAKCYTSLIYSIEKKGEQSDFEKDLVVFKHNTFDKKRCPDEGKTVATISIINFLISDFHA
jgi:hypothetical protein